VEKCDAFHGSLPSSPSAAIVGSWILRSTTSVLAASDAGRCAAFEVANSRQWKFEATAAACYWGFKATGVERGAAVETAGRLEVINEREKAFRAA
jgi:hypothetical protein